MNPGAAIRLSWAGETVPHASLDILRGCNLACPGCYNATARFRPRPRAAVAGELARLLELRRLQTVTVTGGEPLLHPELDRIVRDVKACGLRAALLTNGVLLDGARAAALKAAGLDTILLHVQERQGRPDASDGSAGALRELRRQKAALAAGAGLEVGFSALLYPDEAGRAELRELVAEVAASETAHVLLACPRGDFEALSGTVGDLRGGYRLLRGPGEGVPAVSRLAAEAAALYAILEEAGFGLFSWIGSSSDAGEPRWSAWAAGVLHGPDGVSVLPYRPSRADRLLLRLPFLLGGRNVFHVTDTPARFAAQVGLNVLAGGDRRTGLALLRGALRRGVRLHRKHVVVELPPAVAADGTVVVCRECPDATLRDGRLVPPCLADRVLPPTEAGSGAASEGASALEGDERREAAS